MPDSPAADASSSDPVEWLDRHGDALYRFALLRLGESEAAEDAVQETLLAALRGRERFAGRAQERTWLVGILRHKIVDHLRQRARDAEHAAAADSANPAIACFSPRGKWRDGPARWRRTVGDALESGEFSEVLARCLAGLTAQQRSAFTLREMDDVSSGEICQLLDVSPTNLWTLLHRARAGLRKCLEVNWFQKAG